MSFDSASIPNYHVVHEHAYHADSNAQYESGDNFETGRLLDTPNNHTPQGPSQDSQQNDIDVDCQFWPSSNSSGTGLSNTYAPLVHEDAEYPIQYTTSQAVRENRRINSASRNQGRKEERLGENHGIEHRADLTARNSLREMVLSAVLSEDCTVERVGILEDCRGSAEESGLGIPFREVLSEPTELLGVPPLMYEIMSCRPDWDAMDVGDVNAGLEMVAYLIDNWMDNVLTHGRMGVLMNVIRTACLRRIDEYEGNRLFQYLRPRAFQAQSEEDQRFFDYDISITPLGGVRDKARSTLDFTAMICVPHFVEWLTEAQPAQSPQGSLPDHVSMPHLPARKPTFGTTFSHVVVEFLAAQRAWRLKIDSNSLTLELYDGPGGSTPSNPGEERALLVDARVKVIRPYRGRNSGSAATANDDPSGYANNELLLPRSFLLPSVAVASGPGRSQMRLSPCFSASPGDYCVPRGLDDPQLLHDGRGALLLELTVRFARDPAEPSFVTVCKTPSTSAYASRAGPSRGNNPYQSDFEDDLYVSSDMEDAMGELTLTPRARESEWEEISEVDETEDKDGGWVKASWSGRDEEL